MSTTNNNTANYTVENLIAKYREYVKEQCPKQLVPILEENRIVEVPEDYHSIELLMLSLYKSVAGDNADKFIVKVFSECVSQIKNNYVDAFTEDEYSFLVKNFSEFMDLSITLLDVDIDDFLSKQSRVELVQQYLNPEDGATLYLANSSFDLAKYFPNCNYQGYFCDGEIDLLIATGLMYFFSKGVQSNMFFPFFYEEAGYKMTVPNKGNVKYIVYGTQENSTYRDILALYEALAPNGKMLVFVNKSMMLSKYEQYTELRNVLVKEKTIASIIQNGDILLVIEKREHETVELISSSNRHITIDSSKLTPDCLWPVYYMTVRPKDGISLSSIAYCPSSKKDKESFKEQIGGHFRWDDCPDGERLILPDWMLNLSIPTGSDLSVDFKEANLCNKNLHYVSNSIFDKRRFWIRVVEQPSVLLAVEYNVPNKLHVGYYDKVTKKEYARIHGMPCLLPKEGIDVRYLAALLLLPEVRDQIITLIDNDHSSFSLLLDFVIVPNHDETGRERFLAEAFCEALASSQKELKEQHEQYRKSVRMRKHALTQSLSSVKSMFNALNNYRNLHDGMISDSEQISRVKGTTVKEAFEFIDKNIKDMMPALEHIADVEYSFNKPEWIDPERFIEGYITKKENGWLNFKPSVTWDKGNNQAKADLKDPSTGQLILKKGDAVDMLLFPTDALERVFNNIVSNAQAHGFADSTRKDYELRFSWHTDGIALIVAIENNGTAIPSDRDTTSLLEYGVSSALHQNGHNGIGCNEIDDIMRRYDGKVEIVSSPEKEFTVKYVLTFNRSNIVKYI